MRTAGTVLNSPKIFNEELNRMRGLFMPAFGAKLAQQGFILDLDSLPTEPVDLKAGVIRWLVEVNAPRLDKGLEPIINLDVVKHCPIWKVVSMPLRKVPLTKDALLKNPPVKTVGQKAAPGLINKR